MQKSKTIYVNARFVTQPLTGVQRYAFECCVQMKKKNKHIIFLSPKNILHQDWANTLEVQVIGNFKGHLWEQINLPAFLYREKNYLLFNPCNTAPILLGQNLITIHDLTFCDTKNNHSFVFQFWYRFLLPKITRRALHLFTVSQKVAKEIQKRYLIPFQKISITYNGVASLFQDNNFQAGMHKEKIILSVGSISKRKNFEAIVNAFIHSELSNEYKLLIAGRHLPVFRAIQLTKHPSIEYHFDLDDSLLIDYYRKAEIFISLSDDEGFGIPVLEAIFFQCKVLCSDIETYHELFEDYVYFCDHHRKENIISSLKTMIKERHLKNTDMVSLISRFDYSRSADHILYKMDNLF